MRTKLLYFGSTFMFGQAHGGQGVVRIANGKGEVDGGTLFTTGTSLSRQREVAEWVCSCHFWVMFDICYDAYIT